MTEVKYILDSQYRYSGTSNSPTFSIPDSGIVNPKGFYINKIIIPHSFYNIHEKNRYFAFTDVLGVPVYATLAIGEYTLPNLLIELGTAMGVADTSGEVYTWTQSTLTKKLTVTVTGATGFSITPLLAPTSTPSALPKILGMLNVPGVGDQWGDDNAVTGTYTGFVSYTFNCVPWVAVRTVYVKSSLVSQSKFRSSALVNALPGTSSFFIGQGHQDILHTFHVNTLYGGELKFIESSDTERVVYPLEGTSNITNISFSLWNSNWSQIDLNGRPFLAELTFIF